jgi:hypothetical protein
MPDLKKTFAMMRPAAASAALLLSLTLSTPPSWAAEQAPRDFAGIWWTNAYKPRLAPTDGKALPFTRQGRALYQKNMAGLKSGAIVDEAVHICLPEGLPRALTSAYPFKLVMTPGQVTFIHEANRAYRMAHFVDKHFDPELWDPSFMGEGIAKWSGDTLVIDTTNFKTDRTYLDATGLPASEKLHLIERIRLTGGGQGLEDLVTIDDPVIFTKPWTARFTFQRRTDIELRTDWVCGEKHRDVAAIVGAVRK